MCKKAAQVKVVRANIILSAHEHPKWSNQEIARQAGCTDRAVCKWRRQEKGKPLGRWGLNGIAAHLVMLNMVTSIAANSIGRWFPQEKLKPWRYHSWRHILDPETFLERARPILGLYQSAKELLKKGIWVVCVYEKPSIQARKRQEDPRPADGSGQPQHISPRYERKGALQLFAGLSVADGKVYGQVRNRKRFIDFHAFLLKNIFPEALRRGVHTIKLIMDNNTTGLTLLKNLKLNSEQNNASFV